MERREIKRSRWEQNTLRDFVATADRYGFAIPDEDPIIRDPRLAATQSALDLKSAKFNPFPSPSMVATFALAQHYGVPTRLLDWSWRPLVAAYFACEPVARRHPAGHPRSPNEAPFSVFALRTETQHLFNDHDLDPRLVLITAATATNPNLRAQGGLFTLVQPQRADVPIPDLGALLETVERDIPSASRWRRRFPLLVEFHIPAKDANWLLWQLSLLNITGAFVYPGLKGVVDALRERRYHQCELDCDDQ